MPDGLLLLADRVTGIDAEPGVLGRGTLWTQTDVRRDSWYLNQGRMPAGVLIESGQADLMLISYMGGDFVNRGERVYRLLGCRLTFHGDLPKVGDTLCYDIHVDGHAQQDDIWLFFLHYDCEVDGRQQISVREGQAGFFSDADLAASAGILWSAETAKPCANPRLDAPDVVGTRSSLTNEQIRAFADGRAWDCFGPEFDHCRTHTRSPRIQDERMLFLDEVTDLQSDGGPWGRGYLKAETQISADDWFFDGHFHNDPCMPGTMMFEGCLQALSLHLASLGYTTTRDGWRFQPVRGEEIGLRCRGQVTPQSKKLTYEVFVEEVIAGPVPTVYADLLCTVDGLKAFHARRVGLQLVPDWPLESQPELLEDHVETKAVATVDVGEGRTFEFGYPSLLACAWGRPSDAFGPLYERFDGPGRVPRLPGPPYHFLSRVLAVSGEIGAMELGSSVEVEYDIPADAWYFDENGSRTMPFAVLLEAALQPCGWLASYIGSALTTENELAFRNLDGKGTLLAELLDNAGTLRTKVELTGLSRSAGMIIVNFAVECFLGEQPVYELTTVFGFFPPAALVKQVGQPISDNDRKLAEDAANVSIELIDEPAAYFASSARLGNRKLRMLDRVDEFWPEGGTHGLGAARGRRAIDVGDWYFKAHFFQDPVQPGSLGIEAMIQLLQLFMLESGMADGIDDARFEPLALDHAMSWKYRGQVIPTNQLVAVTIEISERGHDERGPYALASSSLWCDGIRIYSADNLGMRIVSGATPDNSSKVLGAADSPQGTTGGSTQAGLASAAGVASQSTAAVATPNDQGASAPAALVLDPAVDLWLGDHCPTWQRPALPMMSIVDLLAVAVPEGTVTALRDVQVKGWVDFAGPQRLTTSFKPLPALALTGGATSEPQSKDYRVSLHVTENDGNLREVASARVQTCSSFEAAALQRPTPQVWPALGGQPMANPYESGQLFHGPAFQLWRDGALAREGASTSLDAAAGTVPVGLLHPALLDAALHGIPHDDLGQWSELVTADRVAYPARVSELRLYGPAPTQGRVRCEVRFDGFVAVPDLPRFHIQLIDGDRVWAEMVLIEACFPKGPLGSATAASRRAFLRDGEFVEGVALSRRVGERTRLAPRDVLASDWMPGTVQGIYGSDEPRTIAVKEHLARRERIHPRLLPEAVPLSRQRVRVFEEGDEIVVEDCSDDQPHLDLSALRPFWDQLTGVSGPWPGRDLMEGLIQRYVGRVTLEDPAGFQALQGSGAIFVGNHQVQIESILITHILAGLSRTRVVTMANAKHEGRWIGWLLGWLFRYPGCRDPRSIVYFDPAQPAQMFEILAGLKTELAKGGQSFFVHAQGTRARSEKEVTDTISSLFLDLAIEQNLAIVPVRFTRGLPVTPIRGKLEFPVEHSRQDYWIGRAISAEELSSLPYGQRRLRVLGALNELSAGQQMVAAQQPTADRGFAASIAEWSAQTGAGEVEATFLRVLQELPEVSAATRTLLDGAGRGTLELGDDAESSWMAELASRLFGPRGPGVVTSS